MASLKGHLKFGMLTFPIYYTLFYLILFYTLNIEFVPSVPVLVLSYILFVIGSDLPDIDASAAPIRWFVHSLFPPLLTIVLWNLPQVWKLFTWAGIFGAPLIVGVGTLGGFSLGFLLDLLKHRGFLHSHLFGALYGLGCFLVGRYTFNLKGAELTFVTLSGYFGVVTHLVLDYGLRALVGLKPKKVSSSRDS